MTITYQLKTFKDIYTAILEEVGIQSTDSKALNRIKRDINACYLDEICPKSRWDWLRRRVDLEHDAFISTGTATFTASSATVTLTVAPSYSVAGKLIVNTGYNEVYKIKSHTAASTTLVLESKYTGSTSAAATYRIWSRSVPLPTDCRETIEVRQDFRGAPLMNLGYQDMQRLESMAPRAQGRPENYCTGSYVDPDKYSAVTSLPASSTRASATLIRTIKFASTLGALSDTSDTRLLKPGDRIRVSGSGQDLYNIEGVVSQLTTTTNTNDTITYTASRPLQESSTTDASMSVYKENIEGDAERYRELILYPSAYDTRVTLHCDYIIEPPVLVEDDDEPLMPIGDRIVLFYGAVSRTWARFRNNEDYTRNKNEFIDRLMQMTKKIEDSLENPRLIPSKLYLRAKRPGGSVGGISSQADYLGGGSSGSSSNFTGTASRVAVFDASGDLGASTTISTTELGFLDTVLSQVVGISDTNTLTNKTIAVGSNTISGTASRVAIFSSGNALAANAALTAAGVVYTDSNGFPATDVSNLTYSATLGLSTLLPITHGVAEYAPLQSFSMADNASISNVFTYVAATYEASIVEYSIARGAGNREVGRLLIATDGSTVNMTQDYSLLGTTGVVLTADISGGSVRVRYTSTSTGTAPTFKYLHRRWDA